MVGTAGKCGIAGISGSGGWDERAMVGTACVSVRGRGDKIPGISMLGMLLTEP